MFLNKELAQWENHDVCNWLHNRNLRHHIETFEKTNVNGYDLVYLTKDDLKSEFKIMSFHERSTLIKEIRKLVLSHLKLNLTYESEQVQICLDLDLSTELSSLIAYLKRIFIQEQKDNIIIYDNDQEILSPSSKIVELIFLNPNKYKNLYLKTSITSKKNYSDYESKSKYIYASPTVNPVEKPENNIHYKTYSSTEHPKYNEVPSTAYPYRGESKDLYRNENNNDDSISVSNNISRDYSYYNRYLNQNKEKETRDESYYNSVAASYPSVDKSGVRSPARYNNKEYQNRENAYEPVERSEHKERSLPNEPTYDYTPGVASSYYESRYAIPNSPSEYEDVSNNHKQVKFQSEKRIYRDEAKGPKGNSNVDKKSRDDDLIRESRDIKDTRDIKDKNHKPNIKNNLYTPVEDTFRPKNENPKIASNYYTNEENYSTPMNGTKPKIVANNVPKSQRNFYEENPGGHIANSKKNGSSTHEPKPNGNAKKKF